MSFKYLGLAQISAPREYVLDEPGESGQARARMVVDLRKVLNLSGRSSTMCESTPPLIECRATPRASLAALGAKLCQLDFWALIREQVHVPQKTVKYAPHEKLYEVFLGVLAGARGVVEVEEKVRADVALQRACGCQGCAEQSVVQDTLNACTPETVVQLEEACRALFRQYAHSPNHDYAADWQLLDVDMTGLPCGKKAVGATKGYFEGRKNQRGRQLGRVLATRYEEVVVDRLFPGNVQLVTCFQELVQAAEQTLGLDEAQRQRTILRVDAGAGTIAHINWALERGYQYHGKDYYAPRAKALAREVRQWYPDPKVPGREVGWVHEVHPYVRPVFRLAVQCRDPQKPESPGKVCLLISTLPAEEVLRLTGGSPADGANEPAMALAYVYFYDERGGGIETSIKGDKQGLGMGRRNKKRFPAQQVLGLLTALAHNVLIWAREWLAAHTPRVHGYGIERLVRDVFSLSGIIECDSSVFPDQHRERTPEKPQPRRHTKASAPPQPKERCGAAAPPTPTVYRIILNDASHLARKLHTGLQALLEPHGIAVVLGQT